MVCATVIGVTKTTSRIHELPEVFLGSDARAAGLITRRQLSGNYVRRLFQNAYARADVPVTHELRCRAAALIMPAGAVLTGRSAATVRGVELAQPYDPVEIVVPEGSRFGPVKGIHIRRTAVKPKESRAWQQIRIAKPARIALDLVLRLSPRTRSWSQRLRTSVPDLDVFLRSGLVGQKQLRVMFSRRRNRGIVLAREALNLSDPRAESHPESDVRVLLALNGYFLKPQHVVIHNGRFLARLDLGDEELQVGVEYDGRKWHLSPEQIKHDRRRRNRLEKAGWIFVIVDAERLATDYEGIIAEYEKARATQAARIL